MNNSRHGTGNWTNITTIYKHNNTHDNLSILHNGEEWGDHRTEGGGESIRYDLYYESILRSILRWGGMGEQKTNELIGLEMNG